jgi:hypothetical protein
VGPAIAFILVVSVSQLTRVLPSLSLFALTQPCDSHPADLVGPWLSEADSVLLARPARESRWQPYAGCLCVFATACHAAAVLRGLSLLLTHDSCEVEAAPLVGPLLGLSPAPLLTDKGGLCALVGCARDSRCAEMLV